MAKTYNVHFTKTQNAPQPSLLADGEFSIGMNAAKPRIWHKDTGNSIIEYIPLSEIDRKLSELPFARYYTGTLTPSDYFGEDGSIYLQTND